MIEKFIFKAPMKIIFGKGTLEKIQEESDGDKIFIVIDKFLYESKFRRQIDNLFSKKSLHYFTEYTSNPDVNSINNALTEIRNFNATTVIGIGGGSTLDIAKFIAAAAHEKETVEQLRKNGFKEMNKVKCICIPTTAGTGREVTNVSVISDYQNKTKSPFVNDLIFADTAILDPILTLSLPPAMTASCGMDTFCHAIEAYWNKNANDISDMFAERALRLVFENLKSCYDEPENEYFRKNMMKASLYAGLAFSQTRTTVLHAISFPFTSKFGIPHGLACSIMLPSFIRYYGKENEKMERIAKYLGFENVEKFAEGTEQLMDSMKMKRHLKDHKIIHKDFEQIAQETMMEKIATLGPKQVDSRLIKKLMNGVDEE